MSHLKNAMPSRKDSDAKSLFTWKQFCSPLSNNGGVAARDNKHAFNRPNMDSQIEELNMSQDATLLKEANSNLMKKVLQREKECQDLQERLLLSSHANSDLRGEVGELGLENQRLRLQTLALREENDLLHTQLSGIRKSYASFGPCTASGISCFSPWNPGKSAPEENLDPDAGETWEEVSERMLQRMQQEMKQMEDLSHKLSLDPNRTVPVSLPSHHQDKSSASHSQQQVLGNASPDSSLSLGEELESAHSVIHHLQSQTEHLKTQMATQGALLRSSLGQLHKYCAADPSLHIKTRGLSQSSTGSDNLSTGSKFNRPSDELFRAYFTQQLHSSASTVVLKPQDSDSKMAPTISTEDVSVRMTSLHQNASKELQEKVCPMCEVVLPPDTPQEEFENHVFECLDHESTLLLEQYEMV